MSTGTDKKSRGFCTDGNPTYVWSDSQLSVAGPPWTATGPLRTGGWWSMTSTTCCTTRTRPIRTSRYYTRSSLGTCWSSMGTSVSTVRVGPFCFSGDLVSLWDVCLVWRGWRFFGKMWYYDVLLIGVGLVFIGCYGNWLEFVCCYGDGLVLWWICCPSGVKVGVMMVWCVCVS